MKPRYDPTPAIIAAIATATLIPSCASRDLSRHLPPPSSRSVASSAQHAPPCDAPIMVLHKTLPRGRSGVALIVWENGNCLISSAFPDPHPDLVFGHIPARHIQTAMTTLEDHGFFANSGIVVAPDSATAALRVRTHAQESWWECSIVATPPSTTTSDPLDRMYVWLRAIETMASNLQHPDPKKWNSISHTFIRTGEWRDD